MGAAKVGKTAIISQFMTGRFCDDYKTTIEDQYVVDFITDDARSIRVNILDTAGQYQFPAMRNLSIANSDAFVLVYDINDQQSFQEVKDIREDILHLRGQHCESMGDNITIIVVANKTDALSTRTLAQEITEMVVTVDWNETHLETSAKDNLGIDGIFMSLMNRLISRRENNCFLRNSKTSTEQIRFRKQRETNKTKTFLLTKGGIEDQACLIL